MLFTKLTKRKLSLILTCSICLNLLAACEQKRNVEPTNLPSLHAESIDLNSVYKPTEKDEAAESMNDDAEKRMQELEKLITAYLAKKDLSSDHLAIELYNFKRKEHYALNADKYFTAASTYKFPLAVIYYDLMRQGKVQKGSQFKITEAELAEEDGAYRRSAIGSIICVEDLLNPMILHSDNTAAHVLFEELGGFQRYKEMVCETISINKDPNYISEGNKINAQILSAFAKKVYENQSDYKTLLANMQKAEPIHYLNFLPAMHNIMWQKYGSYAEALNSVGLKLDGPEQYSLVVLTNLGRNGEPVVGEIGALVYAFYHPDKLKADEIINKAEHFVAYYQPASDTQPVANHAQFDQSVPVNNINETPNPNNGAAEAEVKVDGTSEPLVDNKNEVVDKDSNQKADATESQVEEVANDTNEQAQAENAAAKDVTDGNSNTASDTYDAASNSNDASSNN